MGWGIRGGGDGNLPVLGTGDTAFDSRVPDECAHWTVGVTATHQALNLESRVRPPHGLRDCGTTAVRRLAMAQIRVRFSAVARGDGQPQAVHGVTRAGCW